MSVLTFIHRFSDILSCRIDVPDEPPKMDSLDQVHINWEGGTPELEDVDELRAWVLLTQQYLTDRWNRHSAYGFGAGPDKTEIWGFSPGEPPELMEILNQGCGE
jgi:hypothetical protein